MITREEQQKYIKLLKQEVKPALGCTEPIAVALAVARSKEALDAIGVKTERVVVEVSSNILKNGMGVGIPGTGMIGLHIASALGAVCGKSEYKLEVLKDVKDDYVVTAKRMVDESLVEIKLSKTPLKLYIKATCMGDGHEAFTIIKNMHDNIVSVDLDKQTIYTDKDTCEITDNSAPSNSDREEMGITVSSIYDFSLNTPLEDIKFILESARLNSAIAHEGLSHNYGLRVGRTIHAKMNQKIFGNGIMIHSMTLTAAASDARMAGCTLPAMSNSGSGNQGIAVTMPVVATAERLESTEEQLVRALVMSHLVAIHIKSYLGRLSALCGCVVASSGAACGITYLLGGNLTEITYAIKNMVGNITGMVCDGAKIGCALKVSSGVSCAVQSAILAADGICIPNSDGIIESDIEKTIYNLASIGSTGMATTDKVILDIMVNKKKDMPRCL